MHTLSTRTLSTIAHERGEEYDPAAPPVTPALTEEPALFENARPIIGRTAATRTRASAVGSAVN